MEFVQNTEEGRRIQISSDKVLEANLRTAEARFSNFLLNAIPEASKKHRELNINTRYSDLYDICNDHSYLWAEEIIQQYWAEIHASNAEIMTRCYNQAIDAFLQHWNTSNTELAMNDRFIGFPQILGAMFSVNVIVVADQNIDAITTVGKDNESVVIHLDEQGSVLSYYCTPKAKSTIIIGYHRGHYAKYVTRPQIYQFLREVAAENAGGLPTQKTFVDYLGRGGELPNLCDSNWIQNLWDSIDANQGGAAN